MGHRDAGGWHVDVQTNMRLRANRDYNLLLALNGTTATLLVDNKDTLSYAFDAREDADGFRYGLNAGMVGIGANNAKGRIDNVAVQVLPPEITLDETENFSGAANLVLSEQSGQWQTGGRSYNATGGGAVSLVDLGLSGGLASSSYLELQTTVSTDGQAGVVFDYYGPDDYKFVLLDVDSNQVIIGHYTARRGLKYDAVLDWNLKSGRDYDLEVSLKGSTVSVSVNGQAAMGHVYNSVLVDGGFGLLGATGSSSFDSLTVQTDDPAFAD
jgi:hypothetical protein